VLVLSAFSVSLPPLSLWVSEVSEEAGAFVLVSSSAIEEIIPLTSTVEDGSVFCHGQVTFVVVSIFIVVGFVVVTLVSESLSMAVAPLRFAAIKKAAHAIKTESMAGTFLFMVRPPGM
jgi:hypothetical protein